jgi:hypothetical protein
VDLVGPEGLLARVTKSVLEAALEIEMTDHRGYEFLDVSGHGSGNSRIGSNQKTVHTDVGPVAIDVARDHAGEFNWCLIWCPISATWFNLDPATAMNALRFNVFPHGATPIHQLAVSPIRPLSHLSRVNQRTKDQAA